jgi:putative (di)nucleoside polyphosphate hydrolase
MVVRKGDGQVLALQRVDHPEAWQLPQGGVEADEDPESAAKRELGEETGLREGVDVDLVRPLTGWLAYELPEEARSPKTGVGQVQKWFEFRPRRDDLVPALETPGAPAEFSGFEWMRVDDLVERAVDFRKAVYREVARALVEPVEPPRRGEEAPPQS